MDFLDEARPEQQEGQFAEDEAEPVSPELVPQGSHLISQPGAYPPGMLVLVAVMHVVYVWVRLRPEQQCAVYVVSGIQKLVTHST